MPSDSQVGTLKHTHILNHMAKPHSCPAYVGCLLYTTSPRNSFNETVCGFKPHTSDMTANCTSAVGATLHILLPFETSAGKNAANCSLCENPSYDCLRLS